MLNVLAELAKALKDTELVEISKKIFKKPKNDSLGIFRISDR